ncbi:MAG: manganese efflux pump [Bacteroides sp.]|nr:manganese efflux pump [Bacteroides sp.]
MIFEIFLLIAALSVDSLAAAVSYGLAKIRIDFFRSMLISVICSIFLVFSAAFAEIVGGYIPERTAKVISFIILLVIGIIKLAEKEKNEKPESLSAAKTVLFAVSMSVDGLAAGFGAGITAEDDLWAVGAMACVITFAAVYLGNAVGLRVNKNAPAIVQKLGGAAIIVVGFCKLV